LARENLSVQDVRAVKRGGKEAAVCKVECILQIRLVVVACLLGLMEWSDNDGEQPSNWSEY